MSGDTEPVGPDLAAETQRLASSACERFERAWRQGERPAIEAFLRDLRGAGRRVVLHELVAREVGLRAEAGDLPALPQYVERFPDDAPVVASAFAAAFRPCAVGPSSAAGERGSPPPTTTDLPPTVSIRSAHSPTETERAPGGGDAPLRFGRYRVVRSLGRGGFGQVFLARDDQLARDVAVKASSARAAVRPDRLEALVTEGRLSAGLRHPAIVQVFDVGRHDDGTVFIVMEYVEGTSLDAVIKEGHLDRARLAGIVAEVAEAAHHAHQAGLVHRDLKPSNVMIDRDGRPRVADFGLAVTEAEQTGRAGEVAGTPHYMAPEQVRGEVHYLDGRTDIWALGVILYRGLTGRLPFTGGDRAALFGEILHREPKPPRQIDDSVPKELERICLKCLSKQMTGRYGSAKDLAEDLRAWLGAAHLPTAPALAAAARVVPKGLRAFEKEDADFFLDLLPGPRDRHGLPESIRFWKNRIEERHGDETFNVGLLYGPSGCGKSSFVKAGLLPRLAEGVVSVCVDAVPDGTGPRILQALRRRLPVVPEAPSLAETFAELRRGGGPKLVVFLDQFEQWLSAHGGSPDRGLVDALRQCDGGRLQAVVLVRDDFAMAAARFMAALDVPIVQGHNFATLDLFDVEHARLVLARFGQAFGRLPPDPDLPSTEQQRFLDAVASGLARDGRVVPVRLALFAEMVKAKPWVPATLEEAGGTEGVGVNFLEETFGSRSANPVHRQLEGPAREVLRALLPGIGSDIKGNMRPTADLLRASGLGDRPSDFAALLRVLDGELRLITPTDPPELAPPAPPPDAPGGGPGAHYWQLTHDYLVPTLRAWLTRKQRETRPGRAVLRLEECEAVWSVRRDVRHLPTLREWVAIRALTDPSRWTARQREMMRRAGRRHGLRLSAAGAAAGAMLVTALLVARHNERMHSQARADALVGRMLVADVAEWPQVAASLAREPTTTASRLAAVADDLRAPWSERLRASYALADRPGAATSRLLGFISSADPPELAAIRRRLAPHAPALAGELWEMAGREASAPLAQLRVAALLAGFDPVGPGWRGLARPVVDTLLTAATLDLDAWAELLRPAAPTLTPLLRERFFDPSAVSAERVNAARVLARYADAPLFTELLLEANAPQFLMLFPAATPHRDAVVAGARAALGRWEGGGAGSPILDRSGDARRARNAAIALLRLDHHGDVEPLMAKTPDPTVRTTVMLEAREFGVPPDFLAAMLDRWTDPAARQAVLLALHPYQEREWPPAARRALTARLAGLVREGPHQAERAAADWLLRQWGEDVPPTPVPTSPPARPSAGRDWWVTSHGHTMTVVDAPRGRRDRVAVSAHEVTVAQYRRFKPDAVFRLRSDPAPGDVVPEDAPANMVTFTDALRYCRWLSEQEGVPEDQMCYPPVDRITAVDASIPENRRRRTGYRLPADDEWDRAAAAGSTTLWFTGSDEGQLPRFAWFAVNSGDHVQPVGLLRPNPRGLFDVAGNVSEWCHSAPAAERDARYTQRGGGAFVMRGGCYNYPGKLLQTEMRYHQPETGYSFTGFRIARTVETDQ
jgi:eukaryotic-like serine/threonine-protein kinase